MTSTQEPPSGDGRHVHPLFARVAQPYLNALNLDRPSEGMIEQLSPETHGKSMAYRRAPTGTPPMKQQRSVSTRLRASVGRVRVGRPGRRRRRHLDRGHGGPGPVPPFCAGISDSNELGLSDDFGDASAAVPA
jgi:hypothetical protein